MYPFSFTHFLATRTLKTVSLTTTSTTYQKYIMSSTKPQLSPIDDISTCPSPSTGNDLHLQYELHTANPIRVDNDRSSPSTHEHHIPLFLLPQSVEELVLGVPANMSPLYPTPPPNSPRYPNPSSIDHHVMETNLLLHHLQRLSFDNTERNNDQYDPQEPISLSHRLPVEYQSGDSLYHSTVVQVVLESTEECSSSSPIPRD